MIGRVLIAVINVWTYVMTFIFSFLWLCSMLADLDGLVVQAPPVCEGV